jgi:hypothetical protein
VPHSRSLSLKSNASKKGLDKNKPDAKHAKETKKLRINGFEKLRVPRAFAVHRF